MLKKLTFFLSLLSLPLFATPNYTYGSCKKTTKDATRLKIIETEIIVNGKPSKVYEIVNSDGSWYLEKKEGQCFNVIVDNQTSVPTSIHWHGLIDPPLEDGVAWVTQAPIAPGKSQGYNFQIVQSGSYWAHTHYGLQEQKLMAIPFIITPKEGTQYRDVIFMFEGFTFKSIEQVWLGLRKELMEKMKIEGKDWIPPLVMKRSKHAPLDLNEMDFDAFLTNRKTLDNPDVQIVEPGEKVRLRLINGSVSSNFHVFLGKLKGEIIALDGSPIVPISFEEFPIATAQRVDVLVTIPKEGGVFPIIAQCQGTKMLTGGILKTKDAKLPKLDSHAKASIGAVTNSIEKEFRAKEPLKPRKVDRTLNVELGGNMKYYTWSINNHVWPNDQLLIVKEGERVEMVFVNKSQMAHPMHLHGHIFQVVEIDGDRFSGAMRDTILVMPNQTVKVQFDANNPGIWAMHCHISYHTWAGMFTAVLYEGYKPPKFTKKQIIDYSRIYGGH